MDTPKTALFKKLNHMFGNYRLLNSWCEALDGLIFPEHRFQYWYQLFSEAARAYDRTNTVDGVHRARNFVKAMLNDINVDRKPLVGDQIGSYNRDFHRKWSQAFTDAFGPNGSRVDQMLPANLEFEMKNLYKSWAEKGALPQGHDQLAKYSEWMDTFNCNEFYLKENYIELPGQNGSNYDQEPNPIKNVKVASFKKRCLVLGSIRRPKKVTVHASNEKDYHLLIKGGEDLRLDQRIQQIFGVMNKIFESDPACENRSLHLKTFKVVPITNRLGCFEWVDNTEPMKAIISREHKRQNGGRDLTESMAHRNRMDWLKGLVAADRAGDLTMQHVALQRAPAHNVIEMFDLH